MPDCTKRSATIQEISKSMLPTDSVKLCKDFKLCLLNFLQFVIFSHVVLNSFNLKYNPILP